LRRRGDALEIHVRTDAPHWIFQERDAGVACSQAAVDVGILQHSGMDIDLANSLAAHAEFVRSWEQRVDGEARFIEQLAPTLVVADLPPLAFAAAARAGVPAVGVANFSWDWIAAGYAANDPRWSPIASHYAGAYASAECVYRLPLHSDFAAFGEIVDVPFVVNRSAKSPAACREALGVAPDDARPLVLVSFGGFGVGRVAGGANEDLSAYRFAMIGETPAGIAGEWTALPSPSPLPHEDLMQACDAVMGKTGYGTVSEALAHGTRFLYLPRAGFPEVPLLESGLERLGCARSMSRADFEAGRWRTALDALFAEPPPPTRPACDGAERITDALLARLDC
jgi:L-arabinokinase